MAREPSRQGGQIAEESMAVLRMRLWAYFLKDPLGIKKKKEGFGRQKVDLTDGGG